MDPCRSHSHFLRLDADSRVDDTWKDHPPLSSEEADQLIFRCEEPSEAGQVASSLSPFGVFPAALETCSDTLTESGTPATITVSDSLENDNVSLDEVEVIDRTSHELSNPTRPPWTNSPFQHVHQTVKPEHGLSSLYASLVDVYVSEVAPTLIPIHDKRNPWLRYPTIALQLSLQGGKRYLLHALMAQAAFALGRKGCEQQRMSALGFRLYSWAVAELRSSIQRGTAGCLDLLTTILTLFFVEVAIIARISVLC